MRSTIVATPTSFSQTEAPPVTAPTPRSPWHYPIPYLFGGLTTMVVLVAAALLILACSYWKRHGQSGGADRDLDRSVKVYQDKVLVIMAGNEVPTCLATPVPVCARKGTSFDEEERGDEAENCQKLKEPTHRHDHQQQQQ